MKKTLILAISILIGGSLISCGNDKAIAFETCNAAKFWLQFQQAYAMEKSYFGSNEEIAFKLPGGSENDERSQTEFFSYRANGIADFAFFEANTRKPIGKCKMGTWSINANLKGNKVQFETSIKGGEACAELTPKFHSLECEI